MCSSSEFLQEFLDLSRNKESELKNGELKLILTPHDVTYLQKVIEKGNSGRMSGSLILTPNDTECMRNALGTLKSFSVKLRQKSDLGCVDFKYFSEVENLELEKIPPGQLIDIDALRPKLKRLKCYQSLKWLKEVLRRSEQDLDNAFWINLKYLEISYNSLEYFDDSLSLLSRLEVLNVSHNKIKSSEGLKLLKDVSYVNLGFNKLVEFPSFSPQTCDSLTSLVLRYNFIENLGGIQYLTHLSELDLGHNLLESHIVLAPLHELNHLSSLRLEGNPLSFFKKHRVRTAVHLNDSILKAIKLDGYSLSSKEIKESFSVGLRVNRLPFRRPLISPTPESNETRSFQPDMFGSLNYSEDASVSSVNSDNDPLIVETIAKAYVKKKKKKQHKRGTTIESLNSNRIEEGKNTQSSSTGTENTEVIEAHIKTKKQIEETRKELGDSWLLSASSILGTEQIVSESWRSQLSETESTNLKETIVAAESNERYLAASSATESIQNLPSNNDKSQDSTEDVFFSTVNDLETIAQPNTSSSFEINSDHSDSADENEYESNLFIVQRNIEGKEITIMLSVGSQILLEKDGLSGKHLNNWKLINLISAQEIQEGENVFVQLEFDVVRKDKRERTYKVDNLESSKTLLALLESFVEARNLKERTLGLTQCLKCDLKFPSSEAHRVVIKTNDSLKEVNACPKCQSLNTVLVNSVENVVTDLTEPSSYSSGSKIHSFFQSMNSAKSFEDSGSVGKNSRPRSVSEEMRAQRKGVSLSPSHLETYKGSSADAISASSSSVDCISLNADENTPPNTVKLVYERGESSKRSESDITVLSNPSQSSIAVISTTSSSIEQINTVGGLDIIYEQELFSNTCPTLGIYDSGSTNDTYYSANFHSPVAKLKDSSKNEGANVLNSSGEISWYDSASAETYINLSQDAIKITKVDEKDVERKFVEAALYESSEIENESKQIWEELEEPISIASDEFLQLDHRLRLKLEVEMFEDGEEFHAAIKARITTSSKLNFDGISVFSNKNVFLFSPIFSGDSIQLLNLNVYDVSSLRMIRTLLGSQAIFFKHQDAGYALNLGDADLCNSFITHIEDVFKSKLNLSEVSFIQSTDKDLTNVKNEVLMSDLIDSAIENSDIEIELFLIVNLLGCEEQMALIVTENSLSLAEIQYYLQRDSSDVHFLLKDKQLISSLISLHISKDSKTVCLHFLNDDENTKAYWVLVTKSKTSSFSLLSTLRKHWENVFLIDLQLSIVSKCLSCGFTD